MRATVSEIVQLITAEIPEYAAEDWDNVGLQAGNPEMSVNGVLVCLEVCDLVIDEAIEKRCNMIIAHHPLIFRPLKTMAETNQKARLLSRLIKTDMVLYVMHTNYDHYDKGLSYLLADALSLTQIEPLIAVKPQKMYKLINYVPTAHYKAVADAAFAAGAGHIGNYAECGFRQEGEGFFKPLSGANPTTGKINQREYVAETRFETLVLEDRLNEVVAAVKRVHPYEEVAYDIIELQQRHYPFALGKKGRLEKSLTVEQFAEHLKKSLSLGGLRLAGDFNKTISTVAVISGAGMDYIGDVAKTGVDAFVTGDAKYHEVVDTMHHGLLVADVGHFESEIIFAKGFARQLEQLIVAKKLAITVQPSTAAQPPFLYF